MNAARPALAVLLQKLLGVRMVVARDGRIGARLRGPARALREIAAGGGATEVVYRLGENHLQADLLADSKTGGFPRSSGQPRRGGCAGAARSSLSGRLHLSRRPLPLALARRKGAVLASDEECARPWRAPRPTRPQPTFQPGGAPG